MKLAGSTLQGVEVLNSIRVKLWAGLMALVIIVLILLWLFQIVFLENFYSGMRISEIRNESISMLKSLGDSKGSGFEERLDYFAYKNDLTFELFDLNGNSLYTAGTGAQMPMMQNNARAEVFKEVLQGKEPEIELTHPRFGNKFVVIGLPYFSSGTLSGAAVVSIPMAPVEDTANILKKQLFYITIILLAASLLISFLISRGFSKPILKIKIVSEKMAAGDFTARIDTVSKDEIGKLAGTINNMGEQLSRLEQLRKELIANVSHELRTPLSLIEGYAETIRDVTGNIPEKRDRHLEIIIEEAERLSRIVDDILNLSQLQSGYFKLNKSSFPIGEFLDSAIKRYDILSEKTGITISRTGKSNAVIEADEARVGQVLYNLINNSFNHTPENGEITVNLLEKPNTVRIEVKDTGSGIPEEELPLIWDRYYKADKKASGAVGTGLGLAIVKGVLEAHDAVYGVESKKNAGTTFWFELKKSAEP